MPLSLTSRMPAGTCSLSVFGDGEIDLESGEVAVVDPDDPGVGVQRTVQFGQRVNFDQGVELTDGVATSSR